MAMRAAKSANHRERVVRPQPPDKTAHRLQHTEIEHAADEIGLPPPPLLPLLPVIKAPTRLASNKSCSRQSQIQCNTRIRVSAQSAKLLLRHTVQLLLPGGKC